MAEVQAAPRPQPRRGEQPGLRPKPQRTGIRIDMTPMVDVAFLLLIFFMVTTVFRRPLAMEINMPEPGAKVTVPESNVMTVYIDGQERVLYRLGREGVAPLAWDDLTPLLIAQAAANDDLIVLVKIAREARYERMVDMMDVLEDAHMQRFSLVEMTDADRDLLEAAP